MGKRTTARAMRHAPGRALRRAVAALAVAAGVMPLAACGEAPSTFTQPEGPTIAIGVAADEPGLALWHDGSYDGFEVDVARYVAGRLGYANKQIVFKQVLPSDRASLLDDGTVDMVVAGMPMPDGQDTQDDGSAPAYAGPYLTVAQGLLARVGDGDDADTVHPDADGIRDMRSLAGRNVCVVAGAGAREALLAEQPKARVRERDTYPQCVTDLMIGTADAVAGDSVVLAGLARAVGRALVTRVPGISYGTVRYAVAVAPGAETLADDVADAIADMRADGTYAEALAGLTDATGWRAS
ncbi:transporter substrate-binding domain-containing protein [Bifidobacterium saguinibicoloris]|uniref:transporter substrate-binding domain-containing protein n=1 Tax=Bifidobacterium saguinibicoloris TaxID=2834433 RepID=UPI001C592DED|nr:transporter substrate-binding domain-containing protein [Bifidobacterium saguinibicoloris]MBW3080643.1 transporter substrate-binding domain-containing protein [Bifidobacterium saguinibicoloris]